MSAIVNATRPATGRLQNDPRLSPQRTALRNAEQAYSIGLATLIGEAVREMFPGAASLAFELQRSDEGTCAELEAVCDRDGRPIWLACGDAGQLDYSGDLAIIEIEHALRDALTTDQGGFMRASRRDPVREWFALDVEQTPPTDEGRVFTDVRELAEHFGFTGDNIDGGATYVINSDLVTFQDGAYRPTFHGWRSIAAIANAQASLFKPDVCGPPIDPDLICSEHDFPYVEVAGARVIVCIGHDGALYVEVETEAAAAWLSRPDGVPHLIVRVNEDVIVDSRVGAVLFGVEN